MSESEVDKILKKYNSNDAIFIKDKDGEYELAEGRIRELTSQFIELCANEAIEREDFSMNSKVVSLLIDIKKAFWPATQKSITASVKDFDKELEKWYVLQKGLLEKDNKSGIIEVVNDSKGY